MNAMHAVTGPRAPDPTPDAPTDEELIARFRATHEAAAFESLVHRYERELFGYLRRYLHDAELAEDVFQATFLRVHLHCDRFESGRPFRPWLYTIATNQAIDAQRRNRRHRVSARVGGDDGPQLADLVASTGPTAGARIEDEETREWLRSAVARLPEPQRSVLALVYERGVKHHEAARLLGIPLGTVKSRLHAALGKLGTAWRRFETQRVAVAAAHVN